MSIRFEWDPEKANANYVKHRVSFEEATSVFFDPLSVAIYDPDHSRDEDRFIILGWSVRKRLLVVVIIRIISARIANLLERQAYEEGT